MTLRGSAVAVALVAITSGHALAQAPVTPPLADVARQAEAAKASARKAKKTYTNSDLSADLHRDPGPEPAPAGGLVSKSTGKPVPADEMIARSEAKAETESEAVAKESEETWRMRAASLRKQVTDMMARTAALERSDPQRDENPLMKRSNDVDLSNARAALDGLRKQWSRLAADAREAKISMAWIEPPPQFQ